MTKFNLEGRSSTPDVDIRNVETAFDPEASREQQDWLNYLKKRPYLDDEGNVRDTETDAVISVDMTDDGNRAYYDQIARDTLHKTSREDLGIMSLARLAREARLNGDMTRLYDILDEVQDKLVEMEAKYDWNADSSTTHFDKVMSIIYDDSTGNDPTETKEESGDLSPVESKQGNPEALTPYEQKFRSKYPDNNKFDEVEEWGQTQAEELRQLEALVADARERFVAAKIAVETSFFQKYFGGEKKQMELTEAAEQLKTLELTLARTKLKSDIEDIKQQAEEGDEAAKAQQQAIAQLMAAHVFEQRRRTEELTTEKFDEMLDNRSGVKKFGAKIGRWFSRGGKVAQWLKAGGTGAVVGAAGVGLAVGGFPITTVVGMASSAAVGGTVKQSVLEERRNLVWVAKDDEEKVKAWQEHLKDVTRSDQADKDVDMLQRMITAGYDESVEESRQRQEYMRKRVRGVMGKYAVGYALGGITGGLVRNFLMPGAETAQAVGDATNSADISSAPADAVERVSVPSVESTPPAIDYTGKYPWDVVAELFDSDQAAERLKEMAEKAKAAGYNVQWHGGGVNQWVEINGQSGTKEVMDILLQYK